jgi:hypothetical protein
MMVCGRVGSLNQIGWHREGISSQASQDAWDFLFGKGGGRVERGLVAPQAQADIAEQPNHKK